MSVDRMHRAAILGGGTHPDWGPTSCQGRAIAGPVNTILALTTVCVHARIPRKGDMAVNTEFTATRLGELADTDVPDTRHEPDKPNDDHPPVGEPSCADESAAAATEVEEGNGRRRRWRPSELTAGVIAVSLVLVAMAALAGWLGWQTLQARDEQQHRAVLLQVGRQAAINLTSIDYTTVDADIQRVLDASAGTFHDEFQSNATAFANVVRQAQTKSQGSVTEAGVESIDGDSAQILVTASVKTSSAGVPEQDPRIWRMRITVAQTPGGAKVFNVGFVP
jgi:Mce-associated membrane protein